LVVGFTVGFTGAGGGSFAVGLPLPADLVGAVGFGATILPADFGGDTGGFVLTAGGFALTAGFVRYDAFNFDGTDLEGGTGLAAEGLAAEGLAAEGLAFPLPVGLTVALAAGFNGLAEGAFMFTWSSFCRTPVSGGGGVDHKVGRRRSPTAAVRPSEKYRGFRPSGNSLIVR